VIFNIAKSEDISKIQEYIDKSANDPNRKPYSWHNFKTPWRETTQSCGGLAREAFDIGRSGTGETIDKIIDYLNPLNYFPTGINS